MDFLAHMGLFGCIDKQPKGQVWSLSKITTLTSVQDKEKEQQKEAYSNVCNFTPRLANNRTLENCEITSDKFTPCMCVLSDYI